MFNFPVTGLWVWVFRGRPLGLLSVAVEEEEESSVVEDFFLRPRREGFGGSAVMGASFVDDLGGRDVQEILVLISGVAIWKLGRELRDKE